MIKAIVRYSKISLEFACARFYKFHAKSLYFRLLHRYALPAQAAVAVIKCKDFFGSIRFVCRNMMPVSPEREQALSEFVSVIQEREDVQAKLNEITALDQLKTIVDSIEPALTGAALIPYEQATSPPKITVDSGVLEKNIPWRLLRCPGGPLVLQMICTNINFALWIESC